MATAEAPPIYTAFLNCLVVFQRCLRNPDLNSYEDQLARYKLWASNINASSVSRHSLDNRLKNSAGTRNMIVQLLRALQVNLEYCKVHALIHTPNPS